MAIATTTSSGAPFAKFTSIGDTLVAAFASDPNATKRQQTGFVQGGGAGPLLWKDGPEPRKPLLEEVMWLIAMPGTTCTIGSDGAAPEAGATVRYSVAGWKWKQAIDARRALPACGPIRAGQAASGDIYTITLIGWSVACDDAVAARRDGHTIEDGRIILRTEDDRNRWVLGQAKTGRNTNAAKDYTLTIRRPRPDEKQWEDLADALYMTRPWAAAQGNPQPQVEADYQEESW